ncbi:hypothetical protein ACHQM5_010803 [Ranunculus cassubicifolius]
MMNRGFSLHTESLSMLVDLVGLDSKWAKMLSISLSEGYEKGQTMGSGLAKHDKSPCSNTKDGILAIMR